MSIFIAACVGVIFTCLWVTLTLPLYKKRGKR